MAENPLLPDDELRRLHALLRVAIRQEAGAARKRPRAAISTDQRPSTRRKPLLPDRAALLAATLLQLRAGDLLVTAPEDEPARQLLPEASMTSGSAPALAEPPPGSPALLSAAAMAAALKVLTPGGLVLCHTRTGSSEPLWAEALSWAQTQQLPLVVACADPSGPRALQKQKSFRAGELGWSSLAVVTRRLGLPVLTVDGEDAVANYRVMQESVLRARASGGPVVLWAVLPAPRRPTLPPPSKSDTSLARLIRYLRARGIRTRP